MRTPKSFARPAPETHDTNPAHIEGEYWSQYFGKGGELWPRCVECGKVHQDPVYNPCFNAACLEAEGY